MQDNVKNVKSIHSLISPYHFITRKAKYINNHLILPFYSVLTVSGQKN